jgi:hypothetical protein
MAVTIDQVEGHVEAPPPTAEAASAMTGPRPAVDPGQLKKGYILIKERELRLRAD